MAINQITQDVGKQFNILFGNMFKFEDSDMELYDTCYENVFKNGINFSYMSSTFFAQFSAELLIGMLSSNPFRKYLIQKLDESSNDTVHSYWDASMNDKRFGIEGRDYTRDTIDIRAMMNETYVKIDALNEWFGTEEGKKEFGMYCLSRKAIKDLKRIICEYPYLIRKYDCDKEFANEIMEFAGIVAKQIVQVTSE